MNHIENITSEKVTYRDSEEFFSSPLNRYMMAMSQSALIECNHVRTDASNPLFCNELKTQ